MATRAVIMYVDDNNNVTATYNHYDGYPDSLGKGLEKWYGTPERAKSIAEEGYISYLDPETGELEQNNQDAPVKTKLPQDLDEAAWEMQDLVNSFGVAYAYIFSPNQPVWTNVKVGNMSSDQARELYRGLLPSIMGEENDEPLEETLGSYETKWSNFISESKAIDDQWSVYVKSLINDIRLNGVDQYKGFSEEDIIEDFEEYIADKMNS